MTTCADCGKKFEGIDRLCPDCSEEFELITSPKNTGWTEHDDLNLDRALDEIGMSLDQKWTASVRLSVIERLAVNWLIDDIRESRKRIQEIVARSLDPFQEGK